MSTYKKIMAIVLIMVLALIVLAAERGENTPTYLFVGASVSVIIGIILTWYLSHSGVPRKISVLPSLIAVAFAAILIAYSIYYAIASLF